MQPSLSPIVRCSAPARSIVIEPRSVGTTATATNAAPPYIHGTDAVVNDLLDAPDLIAGEPEPVPERIRDLRFGQPTCCGPVPARKSKVAVLANRVRTQAAGRDDQQVVAVRLIGVAVQDPNVEGEVRSDGLTPQFA